MQVFLSRCPAMLIMAMIFISFLSIVILIVILMQSLGPIAILNYRMQYTWILEPNIVMLKLCRPFI